MQNNPKICTLGRCKNGGMYAGGYHPELEKGLCPKCGGPLDQKYRMSPPAVFLSPESLNYCQLGLASRLLFSAILTVKILIGQERIV